MDLDASSRRKLADDKQRQHIAHLLQRYPETSESEEAEILHFLKRGPPLQIGLLKSDEAVGPKFDRFRSDHEKEFTVGPRGLLVVTLIVAGIVAICMILWDVGAGG